MEDIVLNQRPVTARDARLRSLIAQLDTDELDEAIGLLVDLIADRQRSPRADTAEPVVRPVMVAD